MAATVSHRDRKIVMAAARLDDAGRHAPFAGGGSRRISPVSS